jgi:serine/threonine protein phosphatase PrpC
VVIRSAAKSDVGRVRKKNEDAFLLNEALNLFVVADGMGGHQGGQTASRMAVATLGDVMGNRREEVAAGFAHDPLDDSPVPRVLSDGVRAACAAVFEAAHKDVDLQGMGTTVTALVIGGGRAFIAHVGDSRCYLQRGDRILQVTDDHSLVNEQVKAGILTWEDSRQSRLKNIITRSVGFERDVAVDTFALPVEAGDRFLLCSDGLANLVDDAEIGLELVKEPLGEVPERLVAMACERGGDDNVTVVCVQVETL